MLLDFRPYLNLDERNSILADTLKALNYFTGDPDAYLIELGKCAAALNEINLEELLNSNFSNINNQIAWWFLLSIKGTLNTEIQTIEHLINCEEYRHLEPFFRKLQSLLSNENINSVFNSFNSEFKELYKVQTNEYLVALLINFDSIGFEISKDKAQMVMSDIRIELPFFKTLIYCCLLNKTIELFYPMEINPEFHFCNNVIDKYFELNTHLF